MGNQSLGARLRRRRQGGERGAAAVEFGLVSILLLLIVAAIVQLSVVFWALQSGSHAAREGARRFAVDPCGAGNIALTQDRVGPAAATGVAVTALPTPGPTTVAGDQITVTVEFTTHDLTGGLIPIPLTVRRAATTRIEDAEDCS